MMVPVVAKPVHVPGHHSKATPLPPLEAVCVLLALSVALMTMAKRRRKKVGFSRPKMTEEGMCVDTSLFTFN